MSFFFLLFIHLIMIDCELLNHLCRAAAAIWPRSPEMLKSSQMSCRRCWKRWLCSSTAGRRTRSPATGLQKPKPSTKFSLFSISQLPLSFWSACLLSGVCRNSCADLLLRILHHQQDNVNYQDKCRGVIHVRHTGSFTTWY